MTPTVKMTAAEQVQMWKCPTTGKLFDTPEKAKKSSIAAKAKATRERNKKKKEKELAELIDYQSNYIRLNATTIEEIPSLIKIKAKEFWGIDVDLSFNSIRPPGKFDHIDAEDPRIKFNVEMTGKALESKQFKLLKEMCNRGDWDINNSRQPSLGDTIFKTNWWGTNLAAFEGIHLGSGNGGRFGESGRGLSMDAHIKIKTFPIIWQKYKQYLSLRGPVEIYKQKMLAIDGAARGFANQTKSVYEQQQVCNAIKDQLEIELKLLNKLILNAQAEYSKFCSGKLVTPPQIPQELIRMFG
jgi:hypothetical protein